MVGFLFWVQEISGSNPDWPLFFYFTDAVIQYNDKGDAGDDSLSFDDASGGMNRFRT